jgi:hypothetical protein
MASLFTNAFGFLASLFLMAWVVWVAFTSSPAERLERSCAPTIWVGKLSTSVAMLADDSGGSVAPMRDWFERTNYGCKFTLWRVFYEEDWKRSQALEQAEKEATKARAQNIPDQRPGPATPAPERRQGGQP